jgi:hypothetical protein
MKLEFLADGSPDCPLIRLFDFSNEEAARLKSLFESLSDGSANDVALHEQSGFEQVNPCRLYLRVGKADRGIRLVSPGLFECVLTANTWDNMAWLVEPFCEPRTSGFQWLNNTMGINLLLSRDGRW